MAKKVVMQKRHVDGLEAPRNSLEMLVETSNSFCGGADNLLDPYQVADNWSEKNYYSSEAPIKELICEEMSERLHSKQNAPSIVARLMGVDMLPSDTKPVTMHVDKRSELQAGKFTIENISKNVPIGHSPCTSKSSRHRKFNSFDSIEGISTERWSGTSIMDKPRSREHPQEEELQKFKKQFEAWQTARMKECSKVIELSSTPSQWLEQENLNHQKIVLSANSMRVTENAKHVEHKRGNAKDTSPETGCLQFKEIKNEFLAAHQKESLSLRKTAPNVAFNQPSLVNSSHELEATSCPTKIVILRPGPDRISDQEESWTSTPGTSEEKGSIEDFLEEVKERLRCELQGKSCKKSTTVREGGIKTFYSEKPSDPKQIAQRIAKEVRESVTRDLGMNLFRSESTRSYRNQIQFNRTSSPEFISRDTRRLLTERLRNVLKEETHQHVPAVVHGRARSSMLNHQRSIAEKSRDVSNTKNKLRYGDSIKGELDMQSRSFRREPNDKSEIQEEISPRNLVRSLSAPVSGTSFGKLLLEDRHILTGAQIRRKHEAVEKVTANMKKQKKEKFNLREKVTSLKYSFTLKGRLFGRKNQSLEEQDELKHDNVKDFLGGSSIMMSFHDSPDNPTEVPPSPVSVCGSVHEEFWRPAECFSPTSISDVSSLEDSMTPHVFKDISSNLKELKRQLNELETDGSEDAMIDEQLIEADMADIEDQAQVYIRDLLLVSGLYNGSCDKSLSSWDPLGKPMNSQVFEEVEESHRQKIKDDDDSSKDQGEKSNHKILFDLLNEALSSVLGPPMSMSKFMRKAVGPVVRQPVGRKLLDQLWQIISVSVHPPTDKAHYSLDTMVARDLQSSPWPRLTDDDLNALGKDIECQIFGDLIDEIVGDSQS